ncbi:hypothetical protein [Methylosoma difficile]
MEKLGKLKFGNGGLGGFLNSIQTLFVGSLRVWSIPIVLMLSVASGFTTYYGLSYFITPWIALVITIAIQSIIVICSLEIAGMHWKANPFRYLSVLLSLLVAISASITFSYFKFYEVSESQSLQISRINDIRTSVNGYLGQLLVVKSQILKAQNADLDAAMKDVSQAYFGTHAEVPQAYKNIVGEGPFWKHYNQRYQSKKDQFTQLEKEFKQLDAAIQGLQGSLNQLEFDTENNYRKVLSGLQDVQMKFNQLATNAGVSVPPPLVLMTYGQFSQGVTPSFAMWNNFSLFAFVCAAMVDFFTFLLSYRLESTAPGPLSEEEQELAFECLRQFSDFRINNNDELEIVIEKTDLERARRYSDWSRMFAVGFLLSRGFLRKIDQRSVEFAPNLYPLIAEKMSAKIRELKAQAAAEQANS